MGAVLAKERLRGAGVFIVGAAGPAQGGSPCLGPCLRATVPQGPTPAQPGILEPHDSPKLSSSALTWSQVAGIELFHVPDKLCLQMGSSESNPVSDTRAVGQVSHLFPRILKFCVIIEAWSLEGETESLKQRRRSGRPQALGTHCPPLGRKPVESVVACNSGGAESG